MARFKIKDQIYTTASLEDVSLTDMILWQAEARQMGLGYSWSDIERNADILEAAGGDPSALQGDVDSLFMLAVTVWASRRIAGEKVSFAEAIDFPLKDLEFLPEPSDRAPKAKKKSQPRKGSAAAVAPVAPAAPTPTLPESKPTSESA